MHNRIMLSLEGFFATEIAMQAKLQHQLVGVTLLSQTNDHKFSSSWLNLASERLLLGVSLQPHARDTRSEPCEFGLLICNAFEYVKATSVAFLHGNSDLEDIRVKAPSD
jgi:hypothetical protein